MADLTDLLLASRESDGVALPSIRVLARHFGVAPLTMHRALGALKDRGLVHSLARKGFFWGEAPVIPARFQARPDRGVLVRERLVSDLRCGVFHPHRDLPPRAALAQIYGVGPRRMGGLLEDLVEDGLLERRGRGFAQPTPPRPAVQGTVLLVTRCDRFGALLLETERQTDFVKSVHREGREKGLRIVVLGWFDDGERGVFLDQDGRVADTKTIPGVLMGCLVSTWLVRDPMELLGRLLALRAPVSVWWEHPPEDFPRPPPRGGLVGFDLSFGPSSGIVVGRHLRSVGDGPVAFVSPFHAAEWSVARLEGVRQGLRESAIRLETFVDPGSGSAHEFHVRAASVAAGERLLRKVLERLLEDLLPLRHGAWVVVNDHAAQVLLGLLRARGLSRPRIVSFDNSSASDSLQFDSFEFHTEGMVRQMLYHVLNPKAALFRGGGLHEMVGRLVLRT